MIKLKDITAGYRGTEIIKNIDISFEKLKLQFQIEH